MAAMAEWFVGPVMDRLMDAFSGYLKDQFRSQTGMEELERLRMNHPRIQAVVSQALISDQNSALNDWIWQLRDAIDEAEDLLDEFEYMKLKEQVTRPNMEATKKRFFITSFLLEAPHKLFRVGERALRIDPNLMRLQEVVQKLDKVSGEVGTFLHLVKNEKQEQQKQDLELYKTRETGSLPKNDLVGRGEDMKFVMQWLREPSTQVLTRTTLYSNISLLSVVGHGGMGKTALLQHVFEEIKEEFDLKMWVCVSTDFDAKKVITHMLEHVENERPSQESLTVLQQKLKSRVQCKRFLLVLDDIWEKEEGDKIKWDNVLAPLACGSLGSKILVSTRMDSAASLMAKVIRKKKETLKLEGLEEDACLQLLNTHAFADVDDVDDHIQLTSISKKIVKKLSASPLAAKVIGGVLNSDLSVRHWNSILNSDIGSTDLGQNSIILILRLSYTFLPKPLQHCFSFGGIFSQDHRFDRGDLVRMWISLGFIQSPTSGKTMEDIGGNYFDILVRKSFFDSFDEYYKMHDLLHELAQSVSAQECFRFEGDTESSFEIPKTIRHLFVANSNLEVLRKISELKNLHSLFLTFDREDQDFIDKLDEIFKTSRSIRCLVINSSYSANIPEAIKNLIHLRYLKSYFVDVTRLPGSLSSLYHLQFIIIAENFGLEHDDFLPRDINNLVSLRYMKMGWNLFPMIFGIGKLISLQCLPGFNVKNENGYRIGELEQMNELHKLKIRFLENLEDAEEACGAKLHEKRNLRHLHLDWHCFKSDTESVTKNVTESETLRNNIVDPVLHAKVLENLQPHNNLEDLFISAYKGAKPAKWMENPNLISNLKRIKLNGCLEWETLPPFEQLPFLESLFLENMPKVKRLCNICVFPSLQKLRIENLEALEHWFDEAKAAEDVWSFPCLTSLYLKNCPNLQELSSLPPKLVGLEIYNIGWKALNNIPTSLKKLHLERLKSLRCLPSSLSTFSSLNLLSLCEMPLIKSLPDLPPSMCDMLSLKKLDELDCLPSSLPSLSSLRTLVITMVPKLRELPDLPSSLDCLYLIHLDQMDCLPSSLSSLSSLQMLYISIVSKLRELPDLPPSLERLIIMKCHPELMECYKEPSGSDWHKIAHIPEVDIRE